jgi:hypothetical protein
VIRNDSDFNLDYIEKFLVDFETTKTIEVDTTIFDNIDNPYLYEMIYF